MFHTHLQPFPPSLIYKSDVVEFAILTKKPGVEQDQFEQVSDAFFERVKHAPGYLCHFRGIKDEDRDVRITFVGWDSMEVGAINCIHIDRTNETYLLVL
jgi:hypothetical protein